MRLTETKSVRIYGEDYIWLLKNRGTGCMPQVIHELIRLAKINPRFDKDKEYPTPACTVSIETEGY